MSLTLRGALFTYLLLNLSANSLFQIPVTGHFSFFLFFFFFGIYDSKLVDSSYFGPTILENKTGHQQHKKINETVLNG